MAKLKQSITKTKRRLRHIRKANARHTRKVRKK